MGLQWVIFKFMIILKLKKNRNQTVNWEQGCIIIDCIGIVSIWNIISEIYVHDAGINMEYFPIFFPHYISDYRLFIL